MVGMTAALSVAPGLAGAELGEYRVGYISQDGMQHRVSLADAQAVRFEVMSPARRFAARKGQRHSLGGACPYSVPSMRRIAHAPGVPDASSSTSLTEIRPIWRVGIGVFDT